MKMSEIRRIKPIIEYVEEDTRYHLVWFILYAFGIPLVCILLMQYVPVFQTGFLNFVLYGIEGATPALAAILTIMKSRGVTGIKHFLTEKYVTNFSVKYILIGFLIPAIILTFAKLVTYITPTHNQFLSLPSGKKMVILLWALIAEELGWRGYLQENLVKKVGEVLTPLLVGIVWLLWHYHFFLSGTMEVPLLIFGFGCIAESYGYYVITKLAKGNVIPASVWHFSGNLMFNLYLLGPSWNGGSIVPYLVANLFYGANIVGFGLYRRLRSQ